MAQMPPIQGKPSPTQQGAPVSPQLSIPLLPHLTLWILVSLGLKPSRWSPVSSQLCSFGDGGALCGDSDFTLEQGFSVLWLLTFQLKSRCFRTCLCIVGYFAASLPSTRNTPTACPFSVVTTQTVSKQGHMAPAGQNCCLWPSGPP